MTIDPRQFPEYHRLCAPQPGRVYFIGPADLRIIKMGFTKWPRSRLYNLALWSPEPLYIHAIALGTQKDERKLHYLFVDQWSHHEWFRPSPDLLALIVQIARLGELPGWLSEIELPPKWTLPHQKPPGGGFISTEKRREAALKSAQIGRRRYGQYTHSPEVRAKMSAAQLQRRKKEREEAARASGVAL